jgi:hypothetical protein
MTVAIVAKSTTCPEGKELYKSGAVTKGVICKVTNGLAVENIDLRNSEKPNPTPAADKRVTTLCIPLFSSSCVWTRKKIISATTSTTGNVSAKNAAKGTREGLPFKKPEIALKSASFII